MPKKTRNFYPPLSPRKKGHLDVDSGHRIYFEECGNPEGQPILFLHGGPGGGIAPAYRRFFDPKRYRIILFDQRACGKSEPLGSIQNNTTWDLINDVEALRRACNIDTWTIFGGSWGSTLGLLYAIHHPERVSALVLRGIFLFRQREMDWFIRSGTPRIYADRWQNFINHLPEHQRVDPIAGYHQLLNCGEIDIELAAANHWLQWEIGAISARSKSGSKPLLPEPAKAIAFARIENHYFTHLGFLGEDNYVLDRVDNLSQIPTWIVHGRLDAICPAENAWDLKMAMPHANLRIVEGAGHSAFEPGILHELVSICDQLVKN